MEQKWFTKKIEHEGFPLYLRKPYYQDIFVYRDKFPRVLRVTQKLQEVESNGLPESEYNKSLSDFDGQMCDLFKLTDDGLIFLIETFGGERSYYYFISDSVEYDRLIQKIKNDNNDIDLETHSYDDRNWNFIKEYPIKL